MPAVETAKVGKKELAAALNWARTTLDRRLKTDARFPVLRRGDQSGGWEFDLAAVRSYLGSGAPPPTAKVQTKQEVAKKPPAIDKAQLRDIVAPPLPQAKPRRSAHHAGEATARQRKDEADASLKENKLRVENGELLLRGELQQAISTLVLSFAHDLDALPEKIAKAIELRDDAIPGLRTMIDKVRSDMADRVQQLLK